MKYRILLVGDNPLCPTGYGVQLKELGKYLLEMKHEVIYFDTAFQMDEMKGGYYRIDQFCNEYFSKSKSFNLQLPLVDCSKEIGNAVIFSLIAGNFSDSATNANIYVSSLPFTSSSASSNDSHITLMTQQVNISGKSSTGYLGAGSNYFIIYQNGNNNDNWDPVKFNEIAGSGTFIRATGVYFTD